MDRAPSVRQFRNGRPAGTGVRSYTDDSWAGANTASNGRSADVFDPPIKSRLQHITGRVRSRGGIFDVHARSIGNGWPLSGGIMSNASRSPHTEYARLSFETLESRTTPTFLPRPLAPPLVVNGIDPPIAGLSIAAGNLIPDPAAPSGFAINQYVTGTGPGTEGLVRVWRLHGVNDSGQPVPLLTIDPFPGFQGGINVAVGYVFEGTTPYIIAAVAANGPPAVKVFDPSGHCVSSFMAFDPGFLGGVNIACGRVLGGIGAGGYPGGTISQFYPQQIIIGAAAGGTPHVVVTDGHGTVLRSFLAFDLGYKGGVTVAAANIDTTRSQDFPVTGVDTNAYDEIIVGAAVNIPHVKAFDVWTGAIQQRLSYYAFDPAIRGGVTVAAGPTDDNPGAQIFVSQIVKPGGAPTIRVFNGSGQEIFEFAPFPAGYTQVVNMVVAYLTPTDFGPGYYDPTDDDDSPGNQNFDFLTQDLAVVAGDGPLFQEPRYFIGLPDAVAGVTGPPPG
jgi:hypothetical protein